MKKFVVIENRTNHWTEKGHTIFHGTVEEQRIVAESNDYNELKEYEFGKKDYKDEHHRYSYTIKKRADAKDSLKWFEWHKKQDRENEARFYNPKFTVLTII